MFRGRGHGRRRRRSRARSSRWTRGWSTRAGKVIPQHVAMLHHLVFTNGGPDNRRGDRACPLKTHPRALLGTSEELRPHDAPARLRLPDQPGRPLARAADGHAPPRRRARVLPRVPRDRRPAPGDRGQAVLAERDPVLARPAVDGAGRRRKGPHRRSRSSRCPRRAGSSPSAATCTAARSSLDLSQPRCGDRTLVRSKPPTRPPDDPLYAVRPLLHEPDPKSISWWQSATGWPIRKGERLKVTAAYDGTRPHTRVMGIDHVYVAPPAPGPGAALRARAAGRARPRPPSFGARAGAPPNVALTLARIGGTDARARRTPAPAPRRRSRATRTVVVATSPFRPEHLRGQPRRGRALALRRARRQARRHARRRPARLRLAVAADGRRYGRRFDRARHLPAAVLAARRLHVAGGEGQARTTAPPRRGSPPPLNARVLVVALDGLAAAEEQVALAEPGDRAPGGLERRLVDARARRRRGRPRSAAAARRRRPARPSRGRSR